MTCFTVCLRTYEIFDKMTTSISAKDDDFIEKLLIQQNFVEKRYFDNMNLALTQGSLNLTHSRDRQFHTRSDHQRKRC